jgi:hypothetical protein
MMAKRKKIKKAGSASRNIHKIATTIAMVPLVTMSSFLFHDSYALAVAEAPPSPVPIARVSKTIDTTSNGEPLRIYLNELFVTGNSMFTGSVSLTDSFNTAAVLDVTHFSNDYGTRVNGELFSLNSGSYMDFYAIKPGSYTVTVKASNGNNTPIENTFTLGIIDKVLVINELDTDHYGLDISDIVKGVNNQVHATDINGDGLIDQTDVAQWLEYIPAAFASTNSNPTGSMPNTYVAYDKSIDIDLNTYFQDAEDDLVYRIYNKTTSTTVSASIDSETHHQLRLFGTSLGTSAYTLVADDQEGGYKISDFTITTFADSAPVLAANKSLYDLVLGQGATYTIPTEGLFVDADAGAPYYDHLTYSLGSGNWDSLNASLESGNIVLSGLTSPGTAIIQLDVDDAFGQSTEKTINVKIPNMSLNNAYDFHGLYNYFGLSSEAYDYSIVTPTADAIASAAISSDSIDSQLIVTGKPGMAGSFTVTVKATNKNLDPSDTVFKTFVVQIAGSTPPP